MSTNCLGPYLLNSFLEPILASTASNSDLNCVRVLWVASLVAVGTPQDGIQFDDKSGSPLVLKNTMENYMQSKVGNVFLASEIGKRLGNSGVISLVGCPATYSISFVKECTLISRSELAPWYPQDRIKSTRS